MRNLLIVFLVALIATPAFAAHQVNLTWTQTTDPVDHNCVLRSATTGGPYVQLGCSPNGQPITSYIDPNVLAGDQWFYVATAVSSKGISSKVSNETNAVIPLLPPTNVLAIPQ